MINNRGTPECEQCKKHRDMAKSSEDAFMVASDLPLWEKDPCIDLKYEKRDYMVSTVFLHFNHAWDDTPVFYETMLFKGKGTWGIGKEVFTERHSSKAEAIAGHESVKKQMDTLSPDEFEAWLRREGF